MTVGITVRQMLPARAVYLQIDDHSRITTALDKVPAGGIRQHRQRAAIGTHVGQPLRRISRIQRHIRTTGFQHGK